MCNIEVVLSSMAQACSGCGSESAHSDQADNGKLIKN